MMKSRTSKAREVGSLRHRNNIGQELHSLEEQYGHHRQSSVSTATTENSSGSEAEQYSQVATQRRSSLDNARMTLSYVKKKMKQLEETDKEDSERVKPALKHRNCPRVYSRFKRPERNVSRHEMHLLKKRSSHTSIACAGNEEEGEDEHESEDSLDEEWSEESVHHYHGSRSNCDEDGDDASCPSEYERSYRSGDEEFYATAPSYYVSDSSTVRDNVWLLRSYCSINKWDRTSSSSEDRTQVAVGRREEESRSLERANKLSKANTVLRTITSALCPDLEALRRQKISINQGGSEDGLREGITSFSCCIGRMQDRMPTKVENFEGVLLGKTPCLSRPRPRFERRPSPPLTPAMSYSERSEMRVFGLPFERERASSSVSVRERSSVQGGHRLSWPCVHVDVAEEGEDSVQCLAPASLISAAATLESVRVEDRQDNPRRVPIGMFPPTPPTMPPPLQLHAGPRKNMVG